MHWTRSWKDGRTSSPTTGMDPGVPCCGMKANPKRYLWCKYERFPMNGCQNMDFKKTLTQKSYLLDMY